MFKTFDSEHTEFDRTASAMHAEAKTYVPSVKAGATAASAVRGVGLHAVHVAHGLLAAMMIALALILVTAPCGQRAFAAMEPLDAEGNFVNTSQQPDSSFIYETSISELANADRLLDKQTIQITGEVVGDIINATDGKYCWVTLASSSDNDDSVVAVYMGKQAAGVIDTLGRYASKGTILQVSGTFHLSCHDHEGISDIHATSVSVVSKGEAIEHPIQTNDMIAAVACIGAGLVLFLLYHILRERRR